MLVIGPMDFHWWSTLSIGSTRRVRLSRKKFVGVEFQNGSVMWLLASDQFNASTRAKLQATELGAVYVTDPNLVIDDLDRELLMTRLRLEVAKDGWTFLQAQRAEE